MASNSDNFLADISKHKGRSLTYRDGLRFGLGFAIANLIITLLVIGAIVGLAMWLHLHVPTH